MTIILTLPLSLRVKFLRPTRHKISHFGDVLPSQSLDVVLKKNKSNTRKAKKHENEIVQAKTDKIQNAKPEQICTNTKPKHKPTVIIESFEFPVTKRNFILLQCVSDRGQQRHTETDATDESQLKL